jgi:hypothetical protein
MRTPVKFFKRDIVPSFRTYAISWNERAFHTPSATAADRQPRVGLTFLPARCSSRLCFALNHVRGQIAHSRLSTAISMWNAAEFRCVRNHRLLSLCRTGPVVSYV